ncbi:MAG: hypothetical protein QOF85_781 [Solirubrobacterales bacterium]|jgi:superfamily II DNA or RNA helicase|nr:hypothetical protein [Solirubrobacterales bacterium]
MVRRRIDDPEIRPLIDRLATLFLREGSVNRVQQLLVAQLADDRSEGYVHSNRLHALLSEDPAKSVNPSTLRTIETAVERLDPEGEGSIPASAAALKDEVAGRWPGTVASVPGGTSAERIRHLAAEINVPPGVVSLLLDAGTADAGDRSAARRDTTIATVRSPDWSFQDTAYERCVRALAGGPNEKVGLVLPTGGGKTRLAIRIMLQVLDRAESENPVVVWVTHRKQLRTQATRELQRAINLGTPDLPAHATALLAGQVEICMVSKLAETLDRHAGRVALVVVDEAHHAAAESYRPIFDRTPQRGLFLTATPNRTDSMPIGVDQIAYATTYRDLFDRGVIVEPVLDELTIDGFDWNLAERVEELAAYLLDEAGDRFLKTLVVVSRVENAERLHEALLRLLSSDHVLNEEDIGFAHGSGSSTGQGIQDFLDEFQARPRGILIATSQLLGEGFDDPSVDSTVITYPTQSVLDLMQVAGRCMRYAPGKHKAFVVQVRDSALTYHWEQGWLYQDISDALRPRLETVPFTGGRDLETTIADILTSHNVSRPVRKAALEAASNLDVNDRFSLLLTGLPYGGPADRFDVDAQWGAVFVTPEERDLFVRVFNGYSERYTEINDKKAFLEQYISVDHQPGSRWRRYMDMLAAMEAAGTERRGETFALASSRPNNTETGTTWLTYITFVYEPALPIDLEAFLADAVNRKEVADMFLDDPTAWSLAVKAPLPLDGSLAALVSDAGADWVERERKALRSHLGSADQRQTFGALAAWRTELDGESPLPQFMLDRFELLLADEGWTHFALSLDNS